MLADRYEAVLQGEALERGLAPLGNGSRSAKVAAVARKLAGGERVNVAVIGGSVVYGIGCTDPMGRTHMNCSWPGRLARALCAAFPKSDVRVLDLSMPASTSRSYLARLPEYLSREHEETDLYVVDFNVNDRAAGPHTAADTVTLVDVVSRRGGAVLFLETLGHFGHKAPWNQRKVARQTWHLSEVHLGSKRGLQCNFNSSV